MLVYIYVKKIMRNPKEIPYTLFIIILPRNSTPQHISYVWVRIMES